MTVERTEQTMIDAKADEVWDTLARFDTIARWAPNVDHSCLMSEQTEGVGMVRRVQVGRAALVETVTGWEPGRELSYTIRGLPPAVGTVTNTWRLEPQGPQTSVTLTTTIEAGSAPPKKLLAKGLSRPLGSASVQMLNGLKAYVEEAAR